MEFYFPAAPTGIAGLRQVLDPVFRSPGFNNGRCQKYLALDFDRFQGYLKGFIDLVFEDGNRYYIVDWKTNRLGPASGDYHHDRICEEMDRHLYTLQGYIYAAALHLHLSQRLPGYSYAEHFGGLRYLFVRGMRPDAEAGHAVWHHCPPPETISSLCAFLVRTGGRP
jgi:exodeoxyribonuclease V beta subunit